MACKQASDAITNLYYLPGGGIEPNEDYITAANREMQEEINLNESDIIEIIDTGKSFDQIFKTPGIINLIKQDNQELITQV